MSRSPTPATPSPHLTPDELRRDVDRLRHEGDRSAADELIERWAGQRFNENNHDLLQSTLGHFPSDWITSRVQAMWWMSRYYHPGPGEEALTAKQDMQAAYDAGERNPLLIYTLAGVLHADGFYSAALSIARTGLDSQPNASDRMLLLSTVADIQSAQRDHEGVLDTATALLALATEQGIMRRIGIANGLLAYAYTGLERYELADQHYLRAINILRQTREWPQLNVHLSNYAQQLVERGLPGEAEPFILEAQGLPGQSPRLKAALALTAATYHHQCGTHTAALMATEEAARLLPETGMHGQATVALQLHAERLAFDGQGPAAHATLRQAQALIGQNNKYQAHQAFSSGVLAWVDGAYDEARRQFTVAEQDPSLLSNWERSRLPFYRLALELKTHGPNHQPDTTALHDALRRIGTDLPLRMDAPVLTEAVQWLARQPGWDQRLRTLFAHPTAKPVQLRMEPFGPLEFHAQGHTLHVPLKRSAELLAFLALHGSASRQDLLTALFDGDTTTKAVDHFKKTLKGLRDALRPLLPEGLDPVVSQDRRYHLHPLLDLSVSWLPERAFAGPALRRSGTIDVRGPFLADVRGDWVMDARPVVHDALRTHLNALVAAGDVSAVRSLTVARGLED